MENLLRSEIERSVKLGEIECFTTDQIRNFTKESYEEINKSVNKEVREEMIEWVALEVKSFRPVEVTDDDTLKKSIQFIRPAQVAWDAPIGDDIQKSRTGKYLDTELNRKLGRAGKRYESLIVKNMETDIEKGKPAVIGEVRIYGGVKYQKVSATGNPNKDWQKVKEGGQLAKEDSGWKEEDGVYTMKSGDMEFEIVPTQNDGEFVLTLNGEGVEKGTLAECKATAKGRINNKTFEENVRKHHNVALKLSDREYTEEELNDIDLKFEDKARMATEILQAMEFLGIKKDKMSDMKKEYGGLKGLYKEIERRISGEKD